MCDSTTDQEVHKTDRRKKKVESHITYSVSPDTISAKYRSLCLKSVTIGCHSIKLRYELLQSRYKSAVTIALHRVTAYSDMVQIDQKDKTMQIILTYPNTPTNRLQAEQSISDLTDEYGEFDSYKTVAVDDNLVTTLEANNAFLNQYDVQYISGDTQALLIE